MKPIEEDEMVLDFLQAEFFSSRFSKFIQGLIQKNKVDERIIIEPNLKSTRENNIRKSVLKDFRGDSTKWLFTGLPADTKWYTKELLRNEILKIQYSTYTYWMTLSNNTRSPVEAAKMIKSGQEIYGQPNDLFWDIARDIKKGKKFARLICLTTSKNAPLILMEGHSRLTAYALLPNYIPDKLEVIVGISPNMSSWGLF